MQPTSFYWSYGKQHDLSPALCTEDPDYAASSKLLFIGSFKDLLRQCGKRN